MYSLAPSGRKLFGPRLHRTAPPRQCTALARCHQLVGSNAVSGLRLPCKFIHSRVAAPAPIRRRGQAIAAAGAPQSLSERRPGLLTSLLVAALWPDGFLQSTRTKMKVLAEETYTC